MRATDIKITGRKGVTMAQRAPELLYWWHTRTVLFGSTGIGQAKQHLTTPVVCVCRARRKDRRAAEHRQNKRPPAHEPARRSRSQRLHYPLDPFHDQLPSMQHRRMETEARKRNPRRREADRGLKGDQSGENRKPANAGSGRDRSSIHASVFTSGPLTRTRLCQS